jgi:hypothetical protein
MRGIPHVIFLAAVTVAFLSGQVATMGQTPALASISGQKWLERPTNAGVLSQNC